MSDSSPVSDSQIDVRTALERITDVVVFVGPQPTRWEYVSPSFGAFFDLSPATVREDATRILERVHPEDRDRVADALDGADERELDFRVERDDGDRWVHVHLQPIDEEDDAGVVGVMTDVTEQKRREQQLVVLHRLLQHDIRNDMAVITGWLDVLAEQTQGTSDIIKRVKTASEQVLNLTEDTRDIVQATTDKLATDREPTPLRSMVSIILEEKRELNPQATFELEFPEEEVVVSANALFSTVIRNLLGNAVTHSDKSDPTVQVTVEERSRTALLTVSDDGPGIPEDQSEKLFQMGERGIDSKGTGLGLYLCRQIVESFEGTIWHDADVTEGATFRVEIPLAAAAED